MNFLCKWKSVSKAKLWSYFSRGFNPQITYSMFVQRLRAIYNTTHGKLSLQFEDDSLDLENFMVNHDIKYEKQCLLCILKYLNNLTAQRVDSFHTEPDKRKISSL